MPGVGEFLSFLSETCKQHLHRNNCLPLRHPQPTPSPMFYCTHIFLCYNLAVELPDCRIWASSASLNIAKLYSEAVVPTYFNINNGPFFLHPYQHFLLLDFLIFVNLMKWYLIFHFVILLIIHKVGHLFMCLLNFLFLICPPIFCWIVLSFASWFERKYIHILWILILYLLHAFQIASPTLRNVIIFSPL